MGTLTKVIHLVTYSNVKINFLRNQKKLDEIDIKNPFDYKSFIGKGLLVANCSKRNSITVDTLLFRVPIWVY